MQRGWDIAAACDLCHKQHHGIMPKNFCICRSPSLKEGVLPSDLSNAVLNIMFIVHSPTIMRSIHDVIGEELLSSTMPLFLYPSHIVSIFLSIAMDLM